jgi:hypothetical protein
VLAWPEFRGAFCGRDDSVFGVRQVRPTGLLRMNDIQRNDTPNRELPVHLPADPTIA